jgi:hypothetical protein
MFKFKRTQIKDYAHRTKSYYLLETNNYTIELEASLNFCEDCILLNFEQVGTEDFFNKSNPERYYVQDHPEDLDYIAQKFIELLDDKNECAFYDQYHEYCFEIYFIKNNAADLNFDLKNYLNITRMSQ